MFKPDIRSNSPDNLGRFLKCRQKDLDEAAPTRVERNITAVHAFAICGE